MSEEIRIKQGASLLLQLTFVDEQSDPLDISGMTVSGQVRTVSDAYVCALPVVGTSQIDVALITVPDTSGWPIGLLRADLRCVAGNLVVLTETFGIRVNKAVTR